MSAGTGDEALRLRARNEQIRSEVDRLRRFVDSLQGLVRVMDTPQGDEAVMAALSTTLAQALETVDAVCGSLLVLDEDSAELVFVLVEGEVPAGQLAWHRIPCDAGLAGWVMAHREAIIANDARADDRFYPEVDEALGFVTESLLAVPVIGQDRVLGVLEVVNKREHGMFDEDDQTLLVLMSRFAGELLHRMSQPARAEEEAQAGDDR